MSSIATDILFLLTLIFILIVYVVIIFIALSFILGAPFVPSKKKNIQKMIEISQIKPGEKVADLGSGDGRIMIACGKAGAEVYGYEINAFLVWLSRRKIKRAGLNNKAFVYWKSFWKVDFSSFDVIIVFGITYIMKELEKKLLKELKPGSRVVSNGFNFPTWKPIKKEGAIYLYKRT